MAEKQMLPFSDLFSFQQIVSPSIFIFNMVRNYRLLNQGVNVQIYYITYYILFMKTGSFFIFK